MGKSVLHPKPPEKQLFAAEQMAMFTAIKKQRNVGQDQRPVVPVCVVCVCVSASFWRRALYNVWLSNVELAIRIEQQHKYFLFQLLQLQKDITRIRAPLHPFFDGNIGVASWSHCHFSSNFQGEGSQSKERMQIHQEPHLLEEPDYEKMKAAIHE
jgi:hypothetical protein